MKKLTMLIFVIFNVTLLQAQKEYQQKAEDQLSKKLLFNLKSGILKDSIALYTFTIELKTNSKKNVTSIQKIVTSDTLCYKLWPKLDSLLNDINFGVFVKKKGINHIIIPIALIITAYNNSPNDPKITVFDIPKKLESIFNSNENNGKYNYIYLPPRTIVMDNRVYN